MNNLLLETFQCLQNLKEEYFTDPDTGKKYWDYKTGDIKDAPNDIIDTSKTGMSFYDQLIPGNSENDYMKEAKNLVGKIEMISPQKYYEYCANNIFDDQTISKLKVQRYWDKESNEIIKTVLTKFKKKLPLPFLNFAEHSQEGLHRMMVIGDLYGWNTKVPVLVIRNYKD